MRITIIIALPSTIGMVIMAEPILNILFPNANSGTILLKITPQSISLVIIAVVM